MEQAVAAIFLVLFSGGSGGADTPQTPPAVVQGGHAGSGDSGHGGVPVNSPEPMTMIALAGGAAAAGGLSRRRKKKLGKL